MKALKVKREEANIYCTPLGVQSPVLDAQLIPACGAGNRMRSISKQ
jgi:hypothetical protein